MNCGVYLEELKLDFDNAISFCQRENFSKPGALIIVFDDIRNKRIERLKKQRLTTNI